MEIQPYTIYVENRPFRIAFLVNPTGEHTWFDKIIEYNRGRWGGRFNPIIFTDGNAIDEVWWKFLKDYDPDIILSTISLEEDLQKKIHIFLSPLSVTITPPNHQYIHIEEDPISILPTKQVISFVARNFFDDESSLVLFEIEEGTPEVIKTFINRNFGVIENGQMTPYHLKRCLETCKKKTYKINNLESLNEALLDLGEFRNRVVFPAQICSVPNSFKDVNYDYDHEKFTVIIGDTSDEIVYFWNRTIIIPNWMRTGITQLWLPSVLANEQTIKEGLGKFINRHTGQTGNSNHQGVKFITFSLTEDNIKQISESFTTTIRQPRTTVKYTNPQTLNLGEHYPFFFLKQGLDFFRAHSHEEHLVLNEPDVEQGGMGGQHWFVDLYIQFRPERFTNIIGQDYWWQLPKRSRLLRDLQIFNKPARINEHGMFSVLMRRKSTFDNNESTLVVKLPDDRRIFSALLCGESYGCHTSNDRERYLSRPFSTMHKSDKGMYLSGVLSLFPDLLNAHHLLEERFWRIIFERMSNQNVAKDEKQVKAVLQTLKKSIDRGRDFKNSEEDLNWLSQKVFLLAKTYSKREIDLLFKDFVEVAQQETDEYNQKNGNNAINFDEKGLKNTITTLIDQNILLVGIKPKCPRCGYRIWYHINEVNQQIVCKGCGYVFALDTEEKWYYRLNSLVRSALSLHGTIPLLLVLGQLMFDCRSSFIYTPSTEVSKEDGEAGVRLWGEIDLLCIKDGQFIIGEIKQSVTLFDAQNFEKIKDTAILLKPDLILFSSMDLEPNTLVSNGIANLKRDLANLEIDVQWYPINPYNFEASPVR